MYYPTSKKILSKKPLINPLVIEIVKSWKSCYLPGWKNQPKEEKLKNIETLLMAICLLTKVKNKDISKVLIKNGDKYCYYPSKLTIYQDDYNPSIISALHELAHHIFGPNELIACRWSIFLFKSCFPKEYKKLHWQKHMLIKN